MIFDVKITEGLTETNDDTTTTTNTRDSVQVNTTPYDCSVDISSDNVSDLFKISEWTSTDVSDNINAVKWFYEWNGKDAGDIESNLESQFDNDEKKTAAVRAACSIDSNNSAQSLNDASWNKCLKHSCTSVINYHRFDAKQRKCSIDTGLFSESDVSLNDYYKILLEDNNWTEISINDLSGCPTITGTATWEDDVMAANDDSNSNDNTDSDSDDETNSTSATTNTNNSSIFNKQEIEKLGI